MSNATIYFFCPDLAKPLGGVRMMYRQVDILNAAGFDACIVHHHQGFHIDWFEHRTRVAHEPVPLRKETDVAVFSEIGGLKIAKWEGTEKKVIFNQNAYYTFTRYPILGAVEDAYANPQVIATIVVSEDSKRYLEYAFPLHQVHRIRYSINPRLYFPQGKKKQICFMPRKNVDDVKQVMNILRCRGALVGWDVVVIDGLTETAAAAAMRESAVFFSFGGPEGFGLPPAEAMAAGCLVVGYHGAGGREFLSPDTGFPIEMHDVINFASTAEDLTRRYAKDPETFSELAKRAAAFIGENYSERRERESIVECWKKILEM